jgi:hypothetical protein
MIVIIAFLCYLLASAFFLLCVMLTARGKEYGSPVTTPHSGALSSSATVAPSLRAEPEPVATVGSVKQLHRRNAAPAWSVRERQDSAIPFARGRAEKAGPGSLG